MKRKLLWLCTVACLVVSLAACGGGASSAAPAEAPVESAESYSAVEQSEANDTTSTEAVAKTHESGAEEAPEEEPGAGNDSYEAAGATWRYRVILNDAELTELTGDSMLSTMNRFAPLSDGEKYVLVKIESVEMDGDEQDIALMWDKADQTKLVFFIDGGIYENSLAVADDTGDLFFYTLIVPDTMREDATMVVEYHDE